MNPTITLNDLLALCECEYIQLRVPLTARLDTIITFDSTDSAELDDVTRLYGNYIVKSLDVLGSRNALRVELCAPTATVPRVE